MTEDREALLNQYIEKEKEYKEKAYKAVIKYLGNNQAKRLLYSSKQRAATTGLEHTITVEDIVIPKTCPYLGIELTNEYRKGRVFSNASIDRINPQLGYIPNNIQIISDLANRMKQNATPEQLVAFAKGILAIHG